MFKHFRETKEGTHGDNPRKQKEKGKGLIKYFFVFKNWHL